MILRRVKLASRGYNVLVNNQSLDPYVLSKIGSNCNNPVNNTNDCKEAATLTLNATFVNADGDGYDLPYGCVSDKVTSGQHRLYWNPKGVAVSNDPNVRQVCKESVGTRFDGMFNMKKVYPDNKCERFLDIYTAKL